MTCAMIGILEIISVLVRKQNDGRLLPKLYGQAMIELNQEIIENERFSIVSVNDDQILSALNLIAQHNINATDAVILRSCLNLYKVRDIVSFYGAVTNVCYVPHSMKVLLYSIPKLKQSPNCKQY